MDRQPRQLVLWATLLLSVCVAVAAQAVGVSNPIAPIHTPIAPSIPVAGTQVILSPIALGVAPLSIEQQKNFLPIVVGGGANSTPTPTDGLGTPSPSSIATRAATVTSLATETETLSPTATATGAAATNTDTPTITDTQANTNTPTITDTPSETATATNTSTASATRTPTNTGTPPTATNSPSRTPTTTATFTIQTGKWIDATQGMTTTQFYVNADHTTLTMVAIYLKMCNDTTINLPNGQIISYAFNIGGTDATGVTVLIHGEFISPTMATGTWSITNFPACGAGTVTGTWTAHPGP